MSFLLSYIIIAEIYALAAMSTNLLIGVTGIFSIAQGAIFGIGAYVVALATLSNTLPFPLAVLFAMVICSLVNVAMALPSLRVSGDYFVVTSLGMQFVLTAVFTNLPGITGGASGLPGVPPPSFFGFELADTQTFVPLSTILLLAGMACYWLVMRSPFGALINAIREDESAVSAAGKNVLMTKVGVAALSGVYVGVAGGLYASFLSFIDPSACDIAASFLLLTMFVVGGARTLAGCLVGPALLMALPQILAVMPIPSSAAGPLRQIIYGALLITFMLFRPQGIAGQKL